jgi:DNA polymerase-3 subunit gamma/tau
LLGAGLAEMRHAPDPRVLLDVATVQLTADAASSDTAALLQRIERLERQVAAGVAAPTDDPAPAPRDPATGRAALGGRARAGAQAATRPATPEPAPVVEPTSEAAGTATEAPEVEPSAPAERTDVAPAAAAVATTITADVWENTVRPALRGMARAVYAPAEFVRSTESTLTLSVPNAAHRAKCEEQRTVVENALTAFVGTAVTVELTDGGGGGAGGVGGGGGRGTESTTRPAADAASATAPSSPSSAPSALVGGEGTGTAGSTPRERGLAAAAAGLDVDGASPEEFSAGSAELPDDDDVDLDDLVDAPPESVKSPIDRLAEAFPGSELIEEAG